MADLTEIVNSLFSKRDNWKNISNDDKEKNFFIINRFLSKSWPTQSQELNNKEVDKSLALDIWYMFLKNKSYPKNFWHKGKIGKNQLKPDQIIILTKELDINQDELTFLNNNHPELISQLLKEFNI